METPKKSPSPTRRGQEFHPTENGSSGDYIVTSGMVLTRLQAAFSEAIPPTTAATNSIEVNKLQEQISKWREGAKAQIEQKVAQMKKWKDQIHNQLSAEEGCRYRAIEKERKTEKLNLIHDAHKGAFYFLVRRLKKFWRLPMMTMTMRTRMVLTAHP